MINLNSYQSNVMTNKSEYNWLKSPVPERELVWLGQTYNGDKISEFGMFSKVETPFDIIRARRNELLEFGMLGCGQYFYFTTFDGQFHINEKNIDFLYRFKDENGQEKVYNFSGQPIAYTDIITYKDVMSNISLESTQQELKALIYQYNFGYKINVMIDNKIFWFQAICYIPINYSPTMNNAMTIHIRLVCDHDLNGDLIIMKNGQYVASVEAPLEKNTAGEFNWEVI